MIDGSGSPAPLLLSVATKEAEASGLFYGSDSRVGALLRTLAASKPGGRFLELGTGLGFGTAWLLHGMDGQARLTTVDVQEAGGVARRCLGQDPRVEFVTMEAGSFLSGLGDRKFDLIFADAPPGKFFDLERAIEALAPGGFYVVDDMIPDPGLPGRALLLEQVVATLARRSDLIVTGLQWATGVVVAARRG
jgi:predicted O-methyltransferase YrrM